MKMRKRYLQYLMVFITFAFFAAYAKAGNPKLDDEMIKHGRYIARIAGCNDCHTPGYIADVQPVVDLAPAVAVSFQPITRPMPFLRVVERQRRAGAHVGRGGPPMAATCGCLSKT